MFPGRRMPSRYGIGNVQPQATAPAQSAAPAAPDPEESWIPFQTTLAANQRIPDIGTDIDKDGEFLLTHLWGTSTGAYTLNLRMPNGRMMSSAPVSNINFVGSVAFKTPVKPIRYPPGSRISLEVQDTSGAPNIIELLFGGLRILQARY